MNLQELVGGVTLPDEAVLEIESLLARKARSREIGDHPRIAILDNLIRRELSQAEIAAIAEPKQRPREDGEALFRRLPRIGAGSEGS